MLMNEISGVIVDSAVRIHKALGPGLFESVYSAVLARELERRGLEVEREVGVAVTWEGVELGIGFRADLVVGGLVLVELKSVEALGAVHRKQVLTYLRLSGLRVGLLINFNVPVMKEGIVRVVNGGDELSR
ncbi:MAG: GxxExxY protein [Acidobacteria bacterium]|nr:GxxExxY protein [Acidobacteriota bacterium]